MSLDKNGLLSLVATNKPDNTTGLITPAKSREIDEQSITSAANLAELTPQNFLGPLSIKGIPVNPLENTIPVNEFSDFPDPMVTAKIYAIGGDIIFPDTLPATWNNLPKNIEFTGSPISSKFTYNGTGVFLKGVDMEQLIVRGVLIDAPLATVYDISDVSSNTIVNLISANIQGCAQVGVFDCFAIVGGLCNIVSADQGVSLSGSKVKVLSIDRITINSASASFVGVDLGVNVLPTLEISNFRSNAPLGAKGFKGLADSGNVLANQKAKISSCEFTGGAVALDTIDEDDFRYKFDTVTGVRDSNPDALITLTGNSTATVISASSVDGSNAVLVAGGWVTKDESQYSTTAAGRITALFESPVPSPISVTASVEPVSGSNVTIAVYVCVNGVLQFESGMIVRADSNNPVTIPVIWQEEMSSTVNTYVEVFVENRSNSTNILVSNAVLRVR